MLAAVNKFRNAGPFPIAIWFVDCPAFYQRFADDVRRMIDDNLAIETDPPKEGLLGYVAGVGIIEWLHEFMEPNDVIAEPDGSHERTDGRVYPWFCNRPGVWLEMSDGSHRPVLFEPVLSLRQRPEFIPQEYRPEIGVYKELGRPSEKAAAQMRRLGMISDLIGEEE
jgi:hypothetical protein